MAWVFPSSSNRPLLFKAHACTGDLSRDRFRANSLAQRQNPLDMLSTTKGRFSQSVALKLCFVASMRDRQLFWSKCLVICVVQRIIHPRTVRQTQWLDPFNRDRRCDRQFREEDILKRWVNSSLFMFSASLENLYSSWRITIGLCSGE